MVRVHFSPYPHQHQLSFLQWGGSFSSHFSDGQWGSAFFSHAHWSCGCLLRNVYVSLLSSFTFIFLEQGWSLLRDLNTDFKHSGGGHSQEHRHGVQKGQLPLRHLKTRFLVLTIVSLELLIFLNINSFLGSLQIFSSGEGLKEVKRTQCCSWPMRKQIATLPNGATCHHHLI